MIATAIAAVRRLLSVAARRSSFRTNGRQRMTDRRGPLDGIRDPRPQPRARGAVLHADAGGPRCGGDQGGASRGWATRPAPGGRPTSRTTAGADTTESAYYLCANRNKRSVTVDFSRPRGRGAGEAASLALRRAGGELQGRRTGQKFGLAYEQLREEFPGLVYCSITGFGQTGPYAHRPGYDMMAQGTGGLISITGEPDRPPSKVPVAINDIMTGMYTAVALLSALRHRDLTGEGQHVDVGLLDVQVSWLANVASNYLIGGQAPPAPGHRASRTPCPTRCSRPGTASSSSPPTTTASSSVSARRPGRPELRRRSRISRATRCACSIGDRLVSDGRGGDPHPLPPPPG